VSPGLNGGSQFGAPSQTGAQPGQQNGLQSGQVGQPGLGGQNSIASSTQPAPLGATDSPVFGGSVIGVASKVKQPSIVVYQAGKTS